MSNTTSMGLAPLTKIKANLDRLFGKDVSGWPSWELETVSELLGIGFDDLTRDKLHILQTLAAAPGMFIDNTSFFLHSTKVINNDPADFNYLPMPSSLELAFAIKQFTELSGITKLQLQQADDLIDCVTYLLIEEGYSEPVAPFDFIPKARFTEGQTPMDTANKSRAIELYIAHMESL